MSKTEAGRTGSPAQKTRPLGGVRVLDMTSIVAGPLCTQVLADYGADVIKVERPEGDVIRHAGPMRNSRMGPIYLHANRNKRSVCLDAKVPGGTDAILKLAATCDVCVANIRPVALAKLGLSYEDMRKVRPDIIFLSIVGFGQEGPYAKKGAVDDVIQAAAGLVKLFQRQDGELRYVPSVIADRITGISAAHAVLAALIHRTNTGQGQAIEVPMYETLAATLLGDHFGGQSYEPPIGPTGYSRLLTPYRKPFRTRDGHLSCSVYNNKQWKVFLHAIGRKELYESDPRFSDAELRAKNYDDVYQLLNGIFATRTSAEWLKLLGDCDIPCSDVRDIDDLFDDPHLAAVGFFEEFDHPHEGRMRTTRVAARWSDADMSIRRHAPRIGEQTREILAEAGYSDEEIDRMISSRAAVE